MNINFIALYENGTNKKYSLVLNEKNYSMKEDQISKLFSFREELEGSFVSDFIQTLQHSSVTEIKINYNNVEIFSIKKPIISNFINIEKENFINVLTCSENK